MQTKFRREKTEGERGKKYGKPEKENDERKRVEKEDKI